MGTAEMTFSVVFRADASLDIGSGHLMRCLTLAEALAATGAACRFVCRDLPGHLAERIAARSFAVDLLTAGQGGAGEEADPPPHAAWLPVSQAEDAHQTRGAIGDTEPDWIVVDHYALDARWERAVRGPATRVMAIDDLADRPHEAELLLDQTLGRKTGAYDGLVPDRCTRLVGSRFALLRPEFAALRPESLARRRDGRLSHVIVGMGGADKANVTGEVLEALAGAAEDLRLTVAMGGQSPTLAEVRARAAAMPGPARVLVDSSEMAAFMAEADLAIGAGGMMSWERCCLGLPTLLLLLAENQAGSARALAAAGACVALGRWGEPGWREALADAVEALRDPAALTAMSDAAAQVCDGAGAGRVARQLLALTPDIRLAETSDTTRIWEWRHADDASRFYRSSEDASYRDHVRWFEKALKDPDRLLLIAEHRGVPVAHLRFDRLEETLAAISIYLAPEARGRRLARPCLEAGIAHARGAGLTRFMAEVHPENLPSVRLFKDAGFRVTRTEQGFLRQEREESVTADMPEADTGGHHD